MLRAHSLDAPVVAVAAAVGARGRSSVAAVRFEGGEPRERFVSPSAAVAGLASFAGEAPIVGFGLADLLGSLAGSGAAPAGSPWDLEELASYVAPDAAEPTAAAMARALLGIDTGADAPAGLDPQGAAELAGWLYLALVERARRLPGAILYRLATLVAQSQSPLAELLSAVAEDPGVSPGGPMMGVDPREVQERLGRQRPIGAPTAARGVDPDEVEALLGADGPFASRFPRYEPRPEQLAMARAVADALATPKEDGPRHLLVEGGTGIGKSVAYLLPAVLFALRNNARVVVSTNTINLQEQLVRKDIPDVLATLESVPGLDVSRFRYSQLKGKANYLCLRRWETMAAAGALTAEEARTLAKTLVWLQDTRTGDRSELRFQGRETVAFERMSASGFATCLGAREGACFYRHARDDAAAAHLVVVNHALLLSDVLVDGSLLPDYEFLVVDEAHNLESEATRQFGFRVGQATVEEIVDRATSDLQGIAAATRVSGLEEVRKDGLRARVEEAQVPLHRARSAWGDLVAGMTGFAKAHRSDAANADGDLLLTSGMRSQPAWSELEIAWDNFDGSMSNSAERMDALWRDLDSLPSESLPGLDDRKGEIIEWVGSVGEVRAQIAGFVSSPEAETVYWLGGLNGAVSLSGAPLEVASRLDAGLFSQKQAVVLTSATLTVREQFDHVRGRLGMESPIELRLGSPFDYERAALLCLPNDAPEPGHPRYVDVLAAAVHDLAVEADGHTMVLFTSHASLRGTASALRRRLASRGLAVLAQGVDGTPQQLVARFQQEPRAVLLGTASFWEGVDIGNASLKVLVLARLPFNVPTEPIFAARSALYEQPFLEYAVPQAVLRFRQGFGRLIRSKGDRGAVVVLDGRLTTKSYGSWFVGSLPTTTVHRGPLAEAVRSVGAWLGQPAEA